MVNGELLKEEDLCGIMAECGVVGKGKEVVLVGVRWWRAPVCGLGMRGD